MNQFVRIATIVALLLSLPAGAYAQESSAVFGEGSVIIGYDNRTCTGALAGSIRYNSSFGIQFCNGNAWVSSKQPRCQDDYTGECYLDAIRSNDDPEFIASNIADGVNVLGVTGTFPGCTAPTNCSSIGDVCSDGSYYIGDIGAGNVYATDATNQISQTWNDGTTNYSTTSVTSTIDGASNTATLVGLTGNLDYPFQAAAYCDGLVAHSHTDWYLPAKDELNLLWNSGSPVAGVLTDGTSYWSSTDDGFTSTVAVQNFNDGSQNPNAKDSTRAVRCIRR